MDLPRCVFSIEDGATMGHLMQQDLVVRSRRIVVLRDILGIIASVRISHVKGTVLRRAVPKRSLP
jgi:hypothetical protein